jgi:hypothetical protein
MVDGSHPASRTERECVMGAEIIIGGFIALAFLGVKFPEFFEKLAGM